MRLITEGGSRDLVTIYDDVISSMDVRGMDTLGINLRVEIINDTMLTQEMWADLLKFYRSLLWAKKQGWIHHPELSNRLKLQP
jgi:hypothetical protein